MTVHTERFGTRHRAALGHHRADRRRRRSSCPRRTARSASSSGRGSSATSASRSWPRRSGRSWRRSTAGAVWAVGSPAMPAVGRRASPTSGGSCPVAGAATAGVEARPPDTGPPPWRTTTRLPRPSAPLNRLIGVIVYNWPLKLVAIALATLLYAGLIVSAATSRVSDGIPINARQPPAEHDHDRVAGRGDRDPLLRRRPDERPDHVGELHGDRRPLAGPAGPPGPVGASRGRVGRSPVPGRSRPRRHSSRFASRRSSLEPCPSSSCRERSPRG